jgi:methyltransferase (TIGR00027 family)
MTHFAGITDVRDTALWVAALRANESARADAAFEDPLAALLAGERGRRIARSFPDAAAVSWGVAMRTSAIDKLIEASLRMGVTAVVNLGAGLDTRPYRMNLPRDLRWVELDFPDLVKTKDAALAHETPNCRVERVGLDLLNRSARAELLGSLAAGSATWLLIAEGMIPYWSNDAVKNLAVDCFAMPSFQYWILDFDNAGRRKTPKGWAALLQAAPFLFQVDDWFTFFEECSWRRRQVITSGEESARLHRPYPFSFPSGLLIRALPSEMRARILSSSGAALLEKCPA